MRRLTWLLIVFPWVGMISLDGEKKGGVRPPVVDPAGSRQDATGDPVRGRVLVPRPGVGAECDPSSFESHEGRLERRPLVDEAWLITLDTRLETDLRLLIGLLGGASLPPRLDAFLATQHGMSVDQRILGKEELLRELLEVATEG